MPLTVEIGPGRVEVPDGAIVHDVTPAPEDVEQLRVVRAELVPGATVVLVLATRRWQAAWRMASLLERFADGCEPDSITIEDLELPGAAVAHRIDGTSTSDQGAEAVTTVVGRTPDGVLVSMTLRLAARDQAAAHVACESLLASFTLRF